MPRWNLSRAQFACERLFQNKRDFQIDSVGNDLTFVHYDLLFLYPCALYVVHSLRGSLDALVDGVLETLTGFRVDFDYLGYRHCMSPRRMACVSSLGKVV